MNDFVHACAILCCTAPSLSPIIAGQFSRNVLECIFIIYFPELKLGERNFPLRNTPTLYKGKRSGGRGNLILQKIMQKSVAARKLIRSVDSGLDSCNLNPHRTRTRNRLRQVSYM